MLKLNGEKHHGDAVIHVGEPFKRENPHYPQAAAFRDVLAKLGLKMTPTVRELWQSATPILSRLSGHRREGTEIRLITLVEVVHADGTREIIGDKEAGLRVAHRQQRARKR